MTEAELGIALTLGSGGTKPVNRIRLVALSGVTGGKTQGKVMLGPYMSLAGGALIPKPCLSRGPISAQAICVHVAKVELCLAESLLSRGPKPLQRPN